VFLIENISDKIKKRISSVFSINTCFQLVLYQ